MLGESGGRSPKNQILVAIWYAALVSQTHKTYRKHTTDELIQRLLLFSSCGIHRSHAGRMALGFVGFVIQNLSAP